MRRMLTAVPLLLLAALTGCGGNGEEGPGVATVGNNVNASASPDPSAPAADEEERQRQFTQCMRDEGIDVDDPKDGKVAIAGGGGDGDKQKALQAMEKCRKYLPNGGEPPRLSPEDIDKMREYAKCMRENGVPDFPDPDPETGAIGLARPAEGGTIRKDDIQAADEKCRDKLPAVQKGGGK